MALSSSPAVRSAYSQISPAPNSSPSHPVRPITSTLEQPLPTTTTLTPEEQQQNDLAWANSSQTVKTPSIEELRQYHRDNLQRMREGKSPLLAATSAIATAKATTAAPATGGANDSSTEQQGPVDLTHTVNSVPSTVPLVMPPQPARQAAEPESNVATLQRKIMAQRQLSEQRKAMDYTRTCARIKRNLNNTAPEIDLDALYEDILAADISSKVPSELEVRPEPEPDPATTVSDATAPENTASAPATTTATDEVSKRSALAQGPTEQPWQKVWDYHAPVVLSVTEHPEAYRPLKRKPLYL